jgi:hypothetical protein
MNKDHLTITVTLDVNDEWASNLDDKQLKDYFRSRLEYAIGFRGRVDRIRLSKSARVTGSPN